VILGTLHTTQCDQVITTKCINVNSSLMSS